MTTTPTARQGRLILMPNTLDFGMDTAAAHLPDIQAALPLQAIELASQLSYWIAESAKTTRAFLKRVGTVRALARPLQELHITELPRPNKGQAKTNGKVDGKASVGAIADGSKAIETLLAPALQGHDIGLISEAGLPAVADPGAVVVQAAHRLGLEVLALAGPSAVMLALASSGLNGQSFAFVGYLPVNAAERNSRLRELEARSRREQQTQILIETPYRNPAMLDGLLAALQPQTRLSVSCGLTLPGGFTRSHTVAQWRKGPALALPTDVPAVFCFLGE
jgi:16S rRNA (cytidine1402-2'-O)-methyltransferase